LTGGEVRCRKCGGGCSDRSNKRFPSKKRKEAAAFGFGWKGKPILTATEWYLHVGGGEGEGGGGGGGVLEVVRMEDKCLPKERGI